MILWRNIIHFIILILTPDFPHFYYMLGGNLGSLLYGDVSVMLWRLRIAKTQINIMEIMKGKEMQHWHGNLDNSSKGLT